MEGVQIDNDEWIGVSVKFEMPDAFDGITPRLARKCQDIVGGAAQENKHYRQNQQAKNWVGHAIGHLLNVDTNDKAGKARMATIIKQWIKNDVLRVEAVPDSRTGREVPCVVVGEWIKPEEIN
jgi:hypothetical protein